MSDPIKPNQSTWLSAADWKRTQDTVPICCVDVVPIQRAAMGEIARVGLIFRDTPHQGRRWCVVGGRLLRNESLTEAAARQIRETLGDEVRFHIEAGAVPHYIVQYFTHERDEGLLDPRQHAVTLTYAVEIEGDVVPRGEAFEFRWFNVKELPPAGQFGFGQETVVAGCLRMLPNFASA